jgi:hypothetical protein
MPTVADVVTDKGVPGAANNHAPVLRASNTGFAFLLDRQAGNLAHGIGGR